MYDWWQKWFYLTASWPSAGSSNFWLVILSPHTACIHGTSNGNNMYDWWQKCLLDSFFAISGVLKLLAGDLVQHVSQALLDDVEGDLVALSPA